MVELPRTGRFMSYVNALRSASTWIGQPVVRPFVKQMRLRAMQLTLCCSLALTATATSGQDVAALKKLSLEDLMNIDVTSVSRRPERRFDTTANVQVISAEDIRRSGVTRLPEALRLAPNLHVAQIDTDLWAISARGFNNGLANKMLVLVDGRTIYSPLFAGVFWDFQDAFMADIEQIEVVSGPGGTVWGANAVNGVISVTTKQARDTQGLLLEAGGGTELREFGGFRYGGAVGRDLHYRFYGKYIDRDASQLPNGEQWTDDSRNARGGFRMDWRPSERDAFELQGDYYEGARGRLTTNNRFESDGFNVLGRWQQTRSTDSNLQLQAYFDRTRRNSEGVFDDTLDTYDLDFQHRTRIADRHNVVWGLGYRRIEDRFVRIAGQAFLPPYLAQDLFSGFVQDEIAFADDRARLTAGMKLEHHDYTGLEWQPSIRLSVKPDERQTAWAAVSRAVRAPSRLDRDLHIPNQPPFAVAGGPDFQSEVLLAYEVGYRLQPHANVSFDIATFYNRYDRLRSVESINPPTSLPLEIRNGLEGDSYGAEVSVEYRPQERWRLNAGYRYLDVRLRVKPGSIDTNSVNVTAHDPDHTFVVTSMLDLPWRLELNTTFRYADRIPTHRVPAYTELDVRVAWRPIAKLELSIAGLNLLDDHHAEFRPIATRHEIERSVFGKIVWGF